MVIQVWCIFLDQPKSNGTKQIKVIVTQVTGAAAKCQSAAEVFPRWRA